MHNAQKILGAENDGKLFIDNGLRRNSVMHVMQFMQGLCIMPRVPPPRRHPTLWQQVPPRGPLAELLSTELPMIEWAQAGAVAVETIVHISGLAVKRPRRISVAMIFTRRTGAFRQLLRPHNLLWN